MEYTVQKLAMLSGVSTRTLRYYDEIGILKPARINSSGYRIYGRNEVDTLQQILFYKELGINLENIKDIMSSSSYNASQALADHYKKLVDKREQLNRLIANVEKTIAEKEGGVKMTDKEKFEGFKQKLIDDNEAKYGDEIRQKYGNDAVEKSNYKVKNMSQKEHDDLQKLNDELIESLVAAYKTGDPAGELAQHAAELHKKWLCFYWDVYSKEAHAGLAQMYVDDERFTAFYDKYQPGLAVFLRDAIFIFTGTSK